MATYIPDKDDLMRHQAKMQGGDDTLSYMQTGEIVIPNEVQRKFPQIAAAALAAIAKSGGNPAQYVAGSPEGNYNPDTNAQQFAWYDDILKYGTQAADWVASSNIGKAAATGLGTAALAKLSGKDTTSSLAAGAGAGLGYLGGNYLQQGFGAMTDNNPDTTFFEPQTQPQAALAPSANMTDALKRAAGTFTMGGLAGGVSGGLAGLTMFEPMPEPNVNLQLDAESQLKMSDIPDYNELVEKFGDDERANVTATLPQTNPIAPLTPMALQGQGGISYKKRVKDRDTGRYRFVDSNEDNDAGAFTRALNSSRRRSGFGGKLMFI